MLKQFFPYEHVKSVFSIDYNKVHDLGYKAIIFDIDATLVPHGQNATAEVEKLFNTIHNTGLKTILLSNNSDERISEFVQNLDVPYIPLADKPRIDGYIKALESLNINKKEALFIGDQIFTDILGANRAGIDNIIVDFLPQENETRLGKKRQVEKIILAFYKKSKIYTNRIGNIEKEK